MSVNTAAARSDDVDETPPPKTTADDDVFIRKVYATKLVSETCAKKDVVIVKLHSGKKGLLLSIFTGVHREVGQVAILAHGLP